MSEGSEKYVPKIILVSLDTLAETSVVKLFVSI